MAKAKTKGRAKAKAKTETPANGRKRRTTYELSLVRSIEPLERMLGDGRPRHKLEVAAIQRQIDDLKTGADRGLRWDKDEADRTVEFASHQCHWKGEWAGKPITLEPFQHHAIIAPLFGWKLEDGTRRFTKVYIELPRKNGKTTLAGTVANKCLIADREEGAEIYAAATKKDQARILFRDSKNLLRRSELLRDEVEILQHSIHYPSLESTFTPLSSDSNTLDGLSPHCCVVDELHAHKTREVYDVLSSGTGSRSQPILFAITTAGSDRTSVCWEQHCYSEGILTGAVQDDSYLAFIAAADAEDDPFDEWTWRKASPNYGVSVKPRFMQDMAKQARHSVHLLANFKQKNLDIWTQSSSGLFDMLKWAKCRVRDGDWPNFVGARVWVGFDMGQRSDAASMSLLFDVDGRFFFKVYSWVSEVAASHRVAVEQQDLRKWVESKHVRSLPGDTISYRRISEDIMAILRPYDVQMFGYDPWAAQGVWEHMQDQGFPVLKQKEIPPHMNHTGRPTMRLDKMIRDEMVAHDGNPAFEWMMGNVIPDTDAFGNFRPSKESSRKKIDAAYASMLAVACRIESPRPPAPAQPAQTFAMRY